jgi:hypothetical protein
MGLGTDLLLELAISTPPVVRLAPALQAPHLSSLRRHRLTVALFNM